MKSGARPDKYYIETYFVLKQTGGGSAIEIAKHVAQRLNEYESSFEDTSRRDDGKIPKKAYKKKIDRCLRDLETDGYLFKRYISKRDGSIIESEDDLKKGTYNVYFYHENYSKQITNEGLLINSGITIYPLSEDTFFECSYQDYYYFNKDKPKLRSNYTRISFYTNYCAPLALDIKNEDLPVRMFFGLDKFISKNGIEKVINEIETIIENKKHLKSRVSIALLRNHAPSHKHIDIDSIFSIYISSNREISISHYPPQDGNSPAPLTIKTYINHLCYSAREEDYKKYSSTGYFFNTKEYQQILDKFIYSKEFKSLDIDSQEKELIQFNQKIIENQSPYDLDIELEKILLPNEEVSNLGHFSPINFKIWNYRIVIDTGTN